jgi:hypothetical protein
MDVIMDLPEDLLANPLVMVQELVLMGLLEEALLDKEAPLLNAERDAVGMKVHQEFLCWCETFLRTLRRKICSGPLVKLEKCATFTFPGITTLSSQRASRL